MFLFNSFSLEGHFWFNPRKPRNYQIVTEMPQIDQTKTSKITIFSSKSRNKDEMKIILIFLCHPQVHKMCTIFPYLV